MAQTIEKNEEGKLTDEAVERLNLGVAHTLKETLRIVSECTPEEILEMHRSQHESEKLKEVVNEAYQVMLEADLPAAFNEIMPTFAQSILNQVFNQTAQKANQNEQALVSHYLGIEYNDISPKDVVEHIKQIEETPRTD